MKLLDRERRKKKEVKKEGEKTEGVECEEKTEDPSDLVVKHRSVVLYYRPVHLPCDLMTRSSDGLGKSLSLLLAWF